MDANDLIKYLGLPATNTEFREFLLKNGVDEIPAYDPDTGNPFSVIELTENGLSMEFIRPIAFSKKFGPPRENGEMIFSKIFIYLASEDDYSAYAGKLPAMLAGMSTVEDCIAQFGKPDRVRDEDDDFGQPNNIEYTWDHVGAHSIFIRYIKDPRAIRHVVITPAKV
ncbi:hypothetical protein [Burkholderia cenocepacia]|uniref:Pyocin immunity protein n=1 Tax=Burkholderia cenocepacia TaxID=95486 RepID=A0A6B2MEL3_9BURK|nr:hypothetical protein [Burkholderia cenocepacia]NDV73506.1 hypothetical protein [Burkholderia cenocepacia]